MDAHASFPIYPLNHPFIRMRLVKKSTDDMLSCKGSDAGLVEHVHVYSNIHTGDATVQFV
jgi:hypothetical protein